LKKKKGNNMDNSSFVIEVRNENYQVEQVDLGKDFEFRISTACNYIMTIHLNDDGIWEANSDVAVLNDTLVEDIGKAIERHDD